MRGLDELEYYLKRIKKDISAAKREEHKEFVRHYKKPLLLLDILFVLMMICNFGALAITDHLVAKEVHIEAKEQNLTVVYKEVNPAAAEIHDYEPVEKDVAYSLMFAFLRQMIPYALMITFYIIYRINIRTTSELYILFFIIPFLFTILCFDFLHDLAIFTAAKIYGG